MSTEISREGIHEMFDDISPTYDLVNRFITLGMDQMWRKRFRKFIPQKKPLKLLDLATGTADQILALIDLVDEAVGIDLAEEMLKIGRKKCAAHKDKVELICASALDIPFPDKSFDVITMSFGIRNVTDTDQALQEMARVLKPGGRALILEGGLVTNPFIKPMHKFYLRHILPRLGGLISKKQSAYRYLNKTIETYPCGKAFCALMENAGFKNVTSHGFAFGSVRLYVGHL